MLASNKKGFIGKIRNLCFNFVSHRFFERVIMSLICINVIVMAMAYDGQPEEYERTLEVVNLVCIHPNVIGDGLRRSFIICFRGCSFRVSLDRFSRSYLPAKCS